MQFQSYAFGKNHWRLDPDLKHVLTKYGRAGEGFFQTIDEFGQFAGGMAYEVADFIDRAARPELINHDLNGNPVDRARLDPAHAQVLKEAAFINRFPYEGGTWHEHFALGYLLADTGLYCSLIVTNQTAYAIYKYAREHEKWLKPLLSGEMWGATWMSETQAGSDLGANRTEARQEAGGWRLYGEDKYFASNAGLADLAIVTARPTDAPQGPKGIALFLVPRLNDSGELNYRVRRFKNKSATRAVPTGEVAFNGSHAYLVGKAELGIYYTLENLTVSRLANAAGAMGLARKAQFEAAYRVCARSTFGSKLIDHPLIRWDLTDLAVRLAGGLALTFHAVDAFDRAWMETPPYNEAYHYARFLSHLTKNSTADHSTYATKLAMELFGGVGFMDDFALARLHRESLVTTIWEGSSNIQALDMLEVMQKKNAHTSFQEEFIPLLEKHRSPASDKACQAIEEVIKMLSGCSLEENQWYGKEHLAKLAHAAQVGLLYTLVDQGGERYAKLASLYADRFLLNKPYSAWALKDRELWELRLEGQRGL
jgi:acyl-CoA dehydrogenase